VDTRDRTAEAVPVTLEHEIDMIRAAITLVANGGAPRVVLAGLRFGEPLLAQARGLAAGTGVAIVPLFRPQSEGADLAIEREDR